MKSRARLFQIMEVADDHDRISRIVDLVIVSLIIVSVFAVMLETVEELGRAYGPYFHALEAFTVCTFTIEYLARLWCAVEDERYRHPFWGRLRYIFSPLAIVDLLAILPFFAPFISQDLLFLRSVRLFRLFRLFRLARYSEAMAILIRVFRQKKEELIIGLVALIVLLIFASGLIYYAEHTVQPDKFSSIPASMWWGVATLTTVGYGDIFPITTLGKICGSIIAILGIGLFALPAGILASGFAEEFARQKEEGTVCPHCGRPFHD